jgi:hypothetical protein
MTQPIVSLSDPFCLHYGHCDIAMALKRILYSARQSSPGMIRRINASNIGTVKPVSP